jgi:hypothetical protein
VLRLKELIHTLGKHEKEFHFMEVDLESRILETGKDHRKNNINILSPMTIGRVKKYTAKYLEENGGLKVGTQRMPRQERLKLMEANPQFGKRNNFGLKYSELIVEYLDKSIKGLPCYHCRNVINSGDRCYSKHKGYNSRSYFHIPCAEKINLI